MTESKIEEKNSRTECIVSRSSQLNVWTFGCIHYKRKCKLVSSCCNMMFTCRLCHDHVADHSMDREIYHCPYCDLCRRGKGLVVICMSLSNSVHTCREMSSEDKCPICHEFLFSWGSSVRILHCGHLMHSACFQAYTCTHYTCPICSKSLGNMQVYFGMLDALLAEEEIPSEHAGYTQVILCNDCEKRGNSPFHWLYHKCPHCGSFNTKVV